MRGEVISPNMYPSQLAQRQPCVADAEKLLALSREANWNQTIADWRLLLTMAEDNALSLWQGARPVATALAVTYGGRFAWICMVLVTANWRGQGIATQLLQTLIKHLTQQGLIIGLDATVAGRAVYQPLGFNDIYPIRRLLARSRPVLSSPWYNDVAEAIVIQPLNTADLDAITAWDAQIFGAARYTVLQALHERLPRCAFIARTTAGDIAGYVLGRDGVTALQLGPVVARDTAVAKSLLLAALAAINPMEWVLIDALEEQQAEQQTQQQSWLVFLHQLGFVEQRSFSRMLLDFEQALDAPEKLFAVAGPELG